MKVENDFETANCRFYALLDILSGYCYVLFRRSFHFSKYLKRPASTYGDSVFFGRLVQKRKTLFSILFDWKKQQSDGYSHTISDSQCLCQFFFNESQFFFCKHIPMLNCEQRLLHCPPQWEDVLSTQLQKPFVPKTALDKLLKKLDAFCSTNQQVCGLFSFYTLQVSIHRKVFAWNWKMFDSAFRAAGINQQSGEGDWIPIIGKKKLLRKEYKVNIERSLKHKINAIDWFSVSRNKWTI